MNKCLLCDSSELERVELEWFQHPHPVPYFKCRNCRLRFVHPDYRLNPEAEKARYLLHENNIHDPGYRQFSAPLLNAIKAVSGPHRVGLDFGAGTGPVISAQLRAQGYTVHEYDPYFSPDQSVLNRKYDFIFACEVVEHFFDPAKEFQLLKSLLNPEGHLLVMTSLYQESVDFKNWHYRKDPTHVTFYEWFTFSWITQKYSFPSVALHEEKVVVMGP